MSNFLELSRKAFAKFAASIDPRVTTRNRLLSNYQRLLVTLGLMLFFLVNSFPETVFTDKDLGYHANHPEGRVFILSRDAWRLSWGAGPAITIRRIDYRRQQFESVVIFISVGIGVGLLQSAKRRGEQLEQREQ